MRFSLRTMISGAFNSKRRFKRLLRLMTRRYKSLKSDVANRPPSSGTSGRKSGGRTGKTLRIIHSGLIPERWKASKTFKRLANFLILASELVALSSSRNFVTSESISILARSSRMASAPLLAVKSLPYCSVALIKSSSVNSMPRLKGVMPGSTTQ